MRQRAPLALILLTMLVAGCSTPASRIHKNQTVFDALPAATRENLRQGRVAIGYDTNMVYIALGRPDRIYHRTTEEDSITIWQYTGYRHRSHHYPVHATHLVRDGRGGFRNVGHTQWIGVTERYPFDRGRVEFRKGKVTALETPGE